MKTTEEKIKTERELATDALKKMGMVKTRMAGWVYKDRLDFCNLHGFIKNEEHGGRKYSGFTDKASKVGYMNVIRYLYGDSDYIN